MKISFLCNKHFLTNQVLIKNCCYGNGCLQHVRHIGRHLGFFENCILCKIAANFTKISRKHMFAASNKNIIKNRV